MLLSCFFPSFCLACTAQDTYYLQRFYFIFSFKHETGLYDGDDFDSGSSHGAMRHGCYMINHSRHPLSTGLSLWPFLFDLWDRMRVILQRLSLARLSLVSWGVWMSCLLRWQAILFSLTPRRWDSWCSPQTTAGIHFCIALQGNFFEARLLKELSSANQQGPSHLPFPLWRMSSSHKCL